MIQIQTPDQVTDQVADVVELFNRYAVADRELTYEVERIRQDTAAESRVSRVTVDRLARLLDDSLIPGVRAAVQLDGLPPSLRQAGIAAWARLELHHRGVGS